MQIPKDKLFHLAAGAAASLFGAACWFVLGNFMVLPHIGYGIVAAACGITAGITKEGADYLSNKASPVPLHDVDIWDALATALPGALTLAAILCL